MPAQFAVVEIVVKDMPAALTFYRHLGWDIPPAMDSEGHVDYTLPNGLRVSWDTYDIMRSFITAWQPPSGTPRISLAFLCDSPAEVDATYARLVGLGYASHNPPFDAAWGQRYAQIEDPDGNVIDLFANLG